ncbi:MAG: PD40 domain-containing protein [Acidobacteria bacterium]|nr:PD40 domain-containing protein [Acidobacteriota bacterium]
MLRKLIACAAVLGAFAVFAFQEDPAGAGKAAAKKEDLYLKAEKTIRFVTDEGTWMSLDVSPDGRTIVFDLLGDLYTLPIEGGKAKRIAGGMSFEAQPRFSPDGAQLVFMSDRSGGENLWISKADGSDPKPLTTGRDPISRQMISPSWTADGQYVITTRTVRGAGHIFLYHKDGGTGVSLGPPPPTPPAPGAGGPPQAPPKHKLGAVASPDGKYVYYAQRDRVFTYNAQFPLWQIVRFNRETGDADTITSAPGSAMRPLLSPDGRYLVYATRHRTETCLRVRDLKTSEERWLVHNVTRDDQESRSTRDTFPGYAFLPGGKELIVPVHGKIQRIDFATGRAAPIPFSVDVEVEIAPRAYSQYRVNDGPDVRAKIIRHPTLSPDGQRLAFTAFNKLYLMDFPSGTPRRATAQNAGESMPAWSPDGQWLVFTTWDTQGGGLMRVPAGGGAPQRLTTRPAMYFSPAYSPDGTKIIFASWPLDEQLLANPEAARDFQSPEEELIEGAPGGERGEISGIGGSLPRDLRWIPSAGGDDTLITTAGRAGFPHFSREPDRVYFTTNQGLASIKLDGVDRRTHLRVTGTGEPPNPAPASVIRLSPDGTRAFAEVQGKHYLITVPSAGRETVAVSVSGRESVVPFKKLSADGGEFLQWSRDGKTLTWSWGRKFFRQPADSDKSESVEISVSMPRAKTEGTAVLRGARVVTMKGDEILARGDVVIEGNRIAAVGEQGKVTVPAGAQIVNVSGKTIIPGLVDAHAHMWAPRDVQQTQVWQYLANLAYGITSTRDPQTSTTDVYAYSDLVETGQVAGPRIFTTGPGIFSMSGLVDKEATRTFVRRYKDAYDTMTVKQYMSGDRIVRQWVAEACQEFGLTPTTEGALDMKLNLTQMVDGYTGHEHSLPLQPLYKDVVEFVAQSGVYYNPTILVAYGAPWTENYWFQNTNVAADPKLRKWIPAEILDGMVRRREQWFLPEEYNHKAIAKGVADIVHAGGRAALGGHGQLQGLGAHWEIWNLQSGGLTTHETLRVATLHSAEAIGLQRDIGSIEPGKLADLVILDRNPLEDIRNTTSVRMVMKNGELFDADTMDATWPKPRKLETPFWWNRDNR